MATTQMTQKQTLVAIQLRRVLDGQAAIAVTQIAAVATFQTGRADAGPVLEEKAAAT